MNDKKEKLLRELTHLEKAHRAGIIDDKEYGKGKDRIDSKLNDIKEDELRSEETNKTVSNIIESPKEPSVEIVDMPEDNYGVIVDEESDMEHENKDPEEHDTYEPIRKRTEERQEDDPENAEQDIDDERMKEKTDDELIKDITDVGPDEQDDDELMTAPVKSVKTERPKPRKILIKRRKKSPEEDEFEKEEAVTFSWRPVLAVLAFIVVFALIYMLFKYTSNAGTAPEVEPAFNAITGQNFSLAVEGMTIPIVVFADYRCGPCKLTREHIKDLQKLYGPSIEVAYKNFPLDENLNAAMAAECAKEQSMLDSYADKLYASPTQDKAALKSYAKDLGLNEKQFSDCLDSEKTRPNVITDYQEGVSMGVKGTPTVFINGKMMAGYQPYADLKEMIDFQLA